MHREGRTSVRFFSFAFLFCLVYSAPSGSISGVGTKDGSSTLNSKGLLLWAIYMLEGFLCLRLGGCFAFQDNDITLSLPGASTANESAMEYFSHTVRLTGLAGRSYEQLYCATALFLPTNTRQARVTELSQELHGLIDASHAARVSFSKGSSVAVHPVLMRILGQLDWKCQR